MTQKEYKKFIDGFIPIADEYLLKLQKKEIQLNVEGALNGYRHIPLLTINEDENLFEYYEWCLFDDLIKKYIIDNFINKKKGKIIGDFYEEIRNDIIDLLFRECKKYNIYYSEVFNTHGMKIGLMFFVDDIKMTIKELDNFEDSIDNFTYLEDTNELYDVYL